VTVKIGWVEIAEGVFVRRYPFLDQNIGVVVGETGVMIVDSRASERHAREILADIRIITPRAPTSVVNTHAHWDHCFGNRTFRPCTIWGHEGMADFLARTLEDQRATTIESAPELADEMAGFAPDLPDRTMRDEATIDLGGRSVDLRFLGRGHTDNDIVVVVSGTDVVFAGDLIEGGDPPGFGDGYPIDWPATDDALLALAAGQYVPGHGPVFDHSQVAAQAEDVRQIADLAQRVAEGHLEFEQAALLAPWPPDIAREPIARGVGQLRGDLD
jgi:glyoxylase-like metal-dependent hydrolase (beta-lactamase superfamily II)